VALARAGDSSFDETGLFRGAPASSFSVRAEKKPKGRQGKTRHCVLLFPPGTPFLDAARSGCGVMGGSPLIEFGA
jgi:hypothetical protein